MILQRQGGSRGERERAGIGPLALKQAGTVEHAYQLLDLLKMMFQSSETSFAKWQETLDLTEKHRVFEIVPPEKPYGSLQAMVKAELGVTIEESKRIVLRNNGGDRRSDEFQSNNYYSETPKQRGTSAEYLTARLNRDAPVIGDALERGEYRSVRQAAIAAGVITPKPTTTHQTTPEAFDRAARKHLTDDQIEQLVEMLEAE
ncbi:MAG: hypothetical protein M3440_03420 [Chloroflexota bacterium]|nr:hypothetical protein [Chloroflexota bacterium]